MPARGAGGSTTSSGPAQSGGRAQFPPPLPEGTPQVCENPPSCWSNSPFPESSLWTKQDRLVRLYRLLTAQMQCACRGLHLALCPMGGLVLLEDPPPVFSASLACLQDLSMLSPEHKNPTPPGTSTVNAGHSHHSAAQLQAPTPAHPAWEPWKPIVLCRGQWL